jgi:hypothetical protein
VFNVASMIVLIINLLRIFTNDSNLFLDMGSKHSINELGTFLLLYLCLLFNGRGGSSSNSTTVGERLLSTLLTEMDGLEEAKVSIKSH